MDGGWVSLFEHFSGQLGQEAEDGRYPAGPATATFRTAVRQLTGRRPASSHDSPNA
jgi:hypothetical protein